MLRRISVLSSVAVLMSAFVMPVRAVTTTYWIDFGSSSGAPTDAKWNTVTLFDPSSPGNLIPPVAKIGAQTIDDESNTKSIQMTNVALSPNERGFRNAGKIGNDNGNFVAPPWVDDNTVGDYEWLFDNNGDGSVIISFDLSGLDASATYGIELFAARWDNGEDKVDVTANGVFANAGIHSSDNFNWGENGRLNRPNESPPNGADVLVWEDLVPVNNAIALNFMNSTEADRRVGLNAIRVTETLDDGGAIPEPATAMLAMLGAGGLIALRRQRN